jgi:hypothetical protein
MVGEYCQNKTLFIIIDFRSYVVKYRLRIISKKVVRRSKYCKDEWWKNEYQIRLKLRNSFFSPKAKLSDPGRAKLGEFGTNNFWKTFANFTWPLLIKPKKLTLLELICNRTLPVKSFQGNFNQYLLDSSKSVNYN